MTKDELFQLLGHSNIHQDLDVKTLILDLVKERFTEEQLMVLFWEHIEFLDVEYVKDYLYRRF